jgi:hypothetical protein
MLGEDDVEQYMITFLNVREKVRLSLVNKSIKTNISDDIIKLFYIFRQWKLNSYERQRINSWSRKNYHPDDRIIF